MPTATLRPPMPGRVLALYSLATLDREGTVYGYSLSERIAAKTDGAWRPGPGAIYPALNSLVQRGLARSARDGARRVYAITPRGRTVLRRFRAQMAGGGPAPDLSLLWAEIAGTDDPGEHLLRHLRRHLDQIDAALARHPDMTIGTRRLRDELITELERTVRRLRARPSRAAARTRGTRP
jgi:DNA-binding PadR family transcriptional regulator